MKFLLGALLSLLFPIPALGADPRSFMPVKITGQTNTIDADVTNVGGKNRLEVNAAQSGTWTTGRTWTLLNSTDSVNAVQSGAWTTGRTWTLSNGTDSIASVQSGTWTTGRTWTLSSGSDSVAATQSGTWNINNVSGTVSLPTGASTSALQTSGNASLTSIDSKTPALGQTTMAGSSPVVIASNQSSIPTTAAYADIAPANQTITAFDSVTSAFTGANGQVFYTGTPTANSAAAFAISSIGEVAIQANLLGAGGTMVVEVSMDGGTFWFRPNVFQTSTQSYANSFTAPFSVILNTSGMTNVRVRGITSWTGTATIIIKETLNGHMVTIADALPGGANNIGSVTQSGTWTVQQGATPTSVGNAWPIKLTDGTNITAVKAASTAAIATDPAAVVTLSPNGNQATAANQATEITSLQLIDNAIGPVSPSTAATNSWLGGGVYNSAAPTLTNTQQAALQLNSSGALLVDTSTASGVATVNRVDVSSTVTSTGNSGTLDSAGFMALSNRIAVIAISGSGAYIQIHLQQSDDGTNWDTKFDSLRLTATGSQIWSAIRISHRYYRYSWDVAGSTPSITFAITTTLKSMQSNPRYRRALYADLDLTTIGNISTVFSANDCKNIAVSFERAADGGTNGNVQIYASIDGTNYFSQTANIAANVNTSNSSSLANQAWLFYVLRVVTATNAGTRVLDIQWSCN